MYKVLIVDDEEIERKGVEKVLIKEFDDKLIIKFATNGKEAIETVFEYKPDLVFMDIKMPGINGIDAMKKIKETNQIIKFVMISAFDSFKYAQAALNNDAYEYLLKPVKRNDIISCVKRLMLNNNKKNINKIQDKKSKEYISNEFIEYIIRQDEVKIREIQELGLAPINIENGGISLIIKSKINDTVVTKLKSELQFSNKFIYKIYDEKLVVFYEAKEKEYKKIIRNLYDDILKNSNKDIKIVYRRYNSIMDIFEVYQNNIIEIYNLKIKEKYPIDFEIELLKNINLKMILKAMNVLEQIFLWVDNSIEEEKLRVNYLMELDVLVKRKLYEKTKKIEILENAIRPDISVEILKENIKMKINKELKILIENEQTASLDVIEDAKNYIKENYSADLSLENVANKMCISSFYFSKLFKKEAKINFIDYLTVIRIKNAKDMIRNSNKSIKYIASQVGYNDPNYFSRVFKKETGYSPSAFKKI